MKGCAQDIEAMAIGNDDFRRVLCAARHGQLVVMALKPQAEIGVEVHKLDPFFRVVAKPCSMASERRIGPGMPWSCPPEPGTTSSTAVTSL
jgi:hypothetical protein